MAIEGRLEEVGLADICQLLSMGRKTGCMTVTDRSNFGYIYFHGGRVVYATVLNRPDRLGELLVRNQAITREQLNTAIAEQSNHRGKRLGQILIDTGMISEEKLNGFVTIQIEEAVYHLFTWEIGAFHFEPGRRPEEGVLLVSINAESLLLEGARRVDEWSQIERKITSMELIFALERDPTQEEFELSREQKKVLPLIDGARTVNAIVLESGLVEFDAAKALYGLLQAGFIQVVGTGGSEESGSEAGLHGHRSLGHAFYRAGMLEDAEREYQAALKEAPGDAHSLGRLAAICIKDGRPQEALGRLDALAGGDRDAALPLRNRGLALELLGRYDEAAETLQRLCDHFPEDPAGQLALGIIRFKLADGKGSRAAFRRYRELLPPGEIPPARYFAYGLLASAVAGEMDEALRIGREGMSKYPTNGPILVHMGVIVEQGGENEAAEALYLRAVGQSPTPPQAHRNLADLAFRRGDHAGARAHFERAVRIDPELGDDVYSKLGIIARDEGDRPAAIRFWKRALELNPENEVAHTNLGLLGVASGR